MKVVSDAKKPVVDLWGVPTVKDTQYRLIRYSIVANNKEERLLLNVVTGEMVLISSEEARVLDNLPVKPTGVIKDLIEHHFLVPVDFDEYKVVNQLRRILRKNDTKEEIIGYSILPTTLCNARCFYCFESGYPQKTMSPETADLVVDYIKKHSNGKTISINWFGGEPLVGRIIIDRICERLLETEIDFNASMITNGSLFTRDLAKNAYEIWHLRRVQITMDGSEEIYNKTKGYIGFGGNPYYRVLDNIGFLLDQKIRVNVRLNMDFHNMDDLPVVIEELADRYGGRNNFYLYVHELFEDEGFNPIHHSREEWKQIERKRAELDAYIREKGCQCNSMNRPDINNLPALRHRYCMADNPSSVLINPLGQIGKCEHHIFKHLVGDIRYKKLDDTLLDYWLDYNMQDYCKVCPLYPFCAIPTVCDGGNGCRAEIADHQLSFIRNLMINAFQNRKQVVEKEV